jgi:signal transduction histidine kinase
MSSRKWLPVVLPFAVGVIGSNLDWSLADEPAAWGGVLASLYYIPIVIAAVSLGLRPAAFVSLVAGGSHGLIGVMVRGDPLLACVAQTMMFLFVAVTTAKLAEWLRSQPAAAGHSNPSPTSTLAQSFNEVQDGSQMSALGRVVVGLVRQFRTPLTSIEGAGWVLEDSRLPDEKRQEFVGIIRKESHRLDRVLSDVLDFARPRRPRYQTVDLANLIEEVTQLASPKDHGPFFLFQTEIAPDFPRLRCDPEQIRQALLNLVMNAIQASPGGGQIEISARVEQGNAVVRVKDHGRGIPPAIASKIFDPFFTTHENSLGLGLPLAVHIVADHGGRIAVEASSERGTCMSVWLPVTGS